MTAKQPMPKEVACVNNLALENYIRSVMSEVPYDDFFRGVHNNDDFLTYDEVTGKLTTLTQNYLLKPSNWISSQAWRRIVENTVAILNDEEAIFKAGRNIFNSAAGLRHALLRFVSAQTIFNRLPKENAKYNKNKRVEIVENKPGHAIVRLHWMDMGTIWGTMVKS